MSEADGAQKVAPVSPKVNTGEDNSLLALAEHKAGQLQALKTKGSLRLNHWGLTDKQEAFAREYAKSKDIRASLVAAGYHYNPDNPLHYRKGKELLKKAKIARRIQDLDAMAAVDVNMTREIYHQMLLDQRKQALAAGDFNGANKCLELLGKSLSYLDNGVKETRNVHLHGHTADPDRVARLTNLAKLIKE